MTLLKKFVGVVPYDFSTTYSCTAKNTLRTVLTPRTVTGRVLLTVRGLTTVRYRILSSLPLLERGDKPYVLEVSPDVRFPQRAAAVTRSFNLQPHRTAAERCS